MSDLQAQLWLHREDAICRSERQARLAWLAQHTPRGGQWVFPGGWIAKQLFEEARYCFVYGQFMAAVLLGMAFVEHTLAGLLRSAGRSELERANFSALLQEALVLGWLNQTEFTKLDELRQVRNPLAHSREPGEEETIAYRSVSQREMPYSILEEDARHVMQAAFHLLAKGAK